jgi:hypothetical protein
MVEIIVTTTTVFLLAAVLTSPSLDVEMEETEQMSCL